MNKIGFTSTIPIEIIFATGLIPVDLNNIFIENNDPNLFIEIAENSGFPRNFCAWTKGMFGVIKEQGFDKIIAVVEGDCSSNKALFENIGINQNIEIIEFSYPKDKNYETLLENIENLMKKLNVKWSDVLLAHKKVHSARKLILEFEKIAQEKLNVSNLDLHLSQVSASDFNGNIEKFCKDIQDKINIACQTEKNDSKIKLAYIGVPPILPKIYKYLDELGVKIVFNEVQRQFAFLDSLNIEFDYENIEKFKKQFVKMYLDYTYPYHLQNRIDDVLKNIKIKDLKIDGIIHYVQSFCHKQVDDISFRSKINLPIFTIEEDRPNNEISERTKIRLEAFVSVLKAKM